MIKGTTNIKAKIVIDYSKAHYNIVLFHTCFIEVISNVGLLGGNILHYGNYKIEISEKKKKKKKLCQLNYIKTGQYCNSSKFEIIFISPVLIIEKDHLFEIENYQVYSCIILCSFTLQAKNIYMYIYIQGVSKRSTFKDFLERLGHIFKNIFLNSTLQPISTSLF